MSRRVVIVSECADWGGSERVVQAAADLFPDAPIVAGDFSHLRGPDVDEPPWASRAHRVPIGRRKHHFLAPLYARRLAATEIGPADVVLCFAHVGWGLGFEAPGGARIVCYSAGLSRALYGHAGEYLCRYSAPARAIVRAALPALRAHDRRLMRRPDRMLTNSRASAADIARIHARHAEVVHPPVRTSFFTPGAGRRRHALAVARAVPHKRLDLVVEAFRGLDEELVVAGHGRELARLRAAAPPNVRFTGFVSDEELRDLYRDSFALVCPSVEEFGIAMAEAHACGIPVIAPAAGGALEIVDDPATGILLDRVDAATLAEAVRAARTRAFEPEACRGSAERFSEERFAGEIRRVIDDDLQRGSAARPGAPEPALVA